jgi:hypothetical protein
MPDFVNLEEVGALTQSGRATNTAAEEHDAQSRTHLDRMMGTAPELQGRGGNAFRGATELSAEDERALAQRFVAEAIDVSGAEADIVGSDENAAAEQQTAAASFGLDRTITS